MANSPTDWTSLGSAIVSGASGLIGNLVQGEYNRKEAKRARSWAEEMWNAQNEYNLPVNQVARLKAAGINPNLAFGSAASTMAGSVGSPPHYSEAPDYGSSIQEGVRTYLSSRFEKMTVLNNIAEQNENIRQKKLNNDTTELLLDESRAAMKSKYLLESFTNDVKRSLFERKSNLELDYLSAKWLNELDKYSAHVPSAQAAHYRALDRLLDVNIDRAKNNFLTELAKGKFERGFYSKNLNPYETSTVAGLIRSILGIGKDFNDNYPIFSDDDWKSTHPDAVESPKETFRSFWDMIFHTDFDTQKEFGKIFLKELRDQLFHRGKYSNKK